jgi:proline iminopeptidase
MSAAETQPGLRGGEHVVMAEGTRLRYRVAGRGPVLVVQPPGWGIGAGLYEATLSPLEQQFTLVYVRPRGSAGEAASPGALDVGGFVADLEALRVHLGVERFALAGHSHGGFIALHYALRPPRRVARLVLLATQITGLDAPAEAAAPAALAPEVAAAMAFLASQGGVGAVFALGGDAEATEFLRRLLPIYFHDPRHMAPLVEHMAAVTLPLATLQAVTASDGQYALRGDALRALDVATVIVAGRHDHMCSLAGAQQLARLLPRADLIVFEHSGHLAWLEEPERFFGELPARVASGA